MLRKILLSMSAVLLLVVSNARANDSNDPEGLRPLCVKIFERQRTCTAEFIPALVAARVKANKPRGVADKDRAEGRERLVKQALEEWKTDSSDPSIARTCSGVGAGMPPAQRQAMQKQGEACLAEVGCQPFVDCILPAISAMWR